MMLNSLIDLFFPKICYACGNAIESKLNHICLHCRHDLPRVDTFILQEDNPIEKIFWGRLQIEKATSFLQYQKDGKVQNLLYYLKYKGIKEIGISLGELTALELKETSFFNDIDLLLPVPIHRRKMKKRGFNQSHLIAEGVSKVSAIKVDKTAVQKIINTPSQTKKGRFQRWENVASSFKVIDNTALEQKHILIIDDVVTTGATIEALGLELLKLEGVKLSLLTIASTF